MSDNCFLNIHWGLILKLVEKAVKAAPKKINLSFLEQVKIRLGVELIGPIDFKSLSVSKIFPDCIPCVAKAKRNISVLTAPDNIEKAYSRKSDHDDAQDELLQAITKKVRRERNNPDFVYKRYFQPCGDELIIPEKLLDHLKDAIHVKDRRCRVKVFRQNSVKTFSALFIDNWFVSIYFFHKKKIWAIYMKDSKKQFPAILQKAIFAGAKPLSQRKLL